MGNNNLQSTHEKIHSGLSGLRNDEKWADMLNFRSSQSRTFVVPHKYQLVRGCPFHSIIPGISGHNFAVGCNGSVGFVGADNVHPYPLWRLGQRYLGQLGSRDAQSQRLIVQGHFTGDRPLRMRVHYIDGKLVPDWSIPDPVTPPPEPPPIDYGCDATVGEFGISGTITDADTEEPLINAKVEFIRFGYSQFTAYTDSNGFFQFNGVFPSYYTFKITKPNYTTHSEDVDVTEEGVYNRQLAWDFVPFNLHSFLTTSDYDLSAFFGVEVVPPGRTGEIVWRLHTDECGTQIEYYIGAVNEDGTLNPDPIYEHGGATAYFDAVNKHFISGYGYPEGMYLQVGYLEDPEDPESGVWPDRPCIAGGDT